MAEKPPGYQSYLIRLWPVEEARDPQSVTKTVWRVTLDDINTRTRYGFADLESAFAFLQQQIQCSKEDCDEME